MNGGATDGEGLVNLAVGEGESRITATVAPEVAAALIGAGWVSTSPPPKRGPGRPRKDAPTA